MDPATDDEVRWAEAQSILERAPTESAERRLRRWRRLQVLFIAAGMLLITVATVTLVVVFGGAFLEEPAEVPTWQVVTGFVIAGAGLLLQGFGVVTLWRDNRRLQVWRSPVAALTRYQRKELTAQIRGRTPVEPAKIAIARLVAEQLLSQRIQILAQLGLGIAFVGLWIAMPSVWRAVLGIGFVLVLALTWPFATRNARSARRFLDEHPPPADSAG